METQTRLSRHMYYIVVSVTLGFLLYTFIKQNERFSKKAD